MKVVIKRNKIKMKDVISRQRNIEAVLLFGENSTPIT